MDAEVKDYTCTPVYKSIKDIIEDESINQEFKPEEKTFLGELQKSMMIELLISQMRPNISVFFHSTNNGEYVPFYGYNQLKALIDYINNEYELFRVDSLPELTGKKFNQLPYVMRATLEKPIVECYFYDNLTVNELDFIRNNLIANGFNN